MSPPLVAYTEVSIDTGEHAGTRVAESGVRLAQAQGVRAYLDPFGTDSHPHRYAHASWTTPEVRPGFVFTELVPTWHARTPDSSWVEVLARIRLPGAAPTWSAWIPLARWADDDASLHPTSVPHHPDRATPGVRVDADTVHVAGGADAWQLRITLLRPEAGDHDGGPVVTYLGAMASTPAAIRQIAPASAPGPASGRLLELPSLSQRIHAGRHPEWGGGGDVWCSPTCVAMVLGYWSTGPDRTALSWVDPSYPDPSVYHAVRHCWDYAYSGAGNWSFNTAYAARYGLRSFVTRLRDLAEAEEFIVAGIPLVASVCVDPHALTGADYVSAGHLVVIAGFTRTGDVIVHDPAASDPATIRRVYRRGQFEYAWRAGSGGIVYVMHTPTVPTPRRSTEPNW